jgi:predicted  nucleic acid-binding Zn-ribbon protein
MNKLTLVVDERELSTLRAALLLLQEQIDALPEDLAEMLENHRSPVTASEIEQLSARLEEQTSNTRGYAVREYLNVNTVVEIDRVSAAAVSR